MVKAAIKAAPIQYVVIDARIRGNPASMVASTITFATAE
jgi:hypothetical protein